MKILFSHYAIIDRQGFGRSFMLARELANEGHDVTFLTTLPSITFAFPYLREVRDKVTIIAFPDIVPDAMRRTGFGFLSVILRSLFLFFKDFDIYHADVGHRPSGGIPIIFKKLVFDITYVSEWWDYFGKGGQYDSKKGYKKFTHGFYDLLFEIPEKKIANGVICLSHAMYNRARELDLKDQKVTVITGGADCRSIKYFPTTSLKEKYNIPRPSLTFGFIGMNRGELEDITPFIKASQKMRTRGLNLNWFTTGKYLSRKIKRELGIGKELIEFGWVDYSEYQEIISCADIFILIQQENLKNKTRWPNKLGDYLAAGRPILINPYGEPGNLVKENEEFFLVTKYDSVQIVNTIIQHINSKKQIDYDSIRNFAEREFSWRNKCIRLQSFYRTLLNAQ